MALTVSLSNIINFLTDRLKLLFTLNKSHLTVAEFVVTVKERLWFKVT